MKIKVVVVKFWILLLYQTEAQECSRDKSRIVRGVIDHSLQAVYKTFGASMPRSCPFYPDRDLYHLHEAHKTEESYGKWYCDYCGKSFYAEVYLDRHLQNKHSNHLYMGPDAVCLSDFCDIFRCDVISGRAEPNFWDTALCIDDDMSDSVDKCDKVFANCIPKKDGHNTSMQVLNKMKSIVCSSLTCRRYWYTGKIDESQWKMLLKTFCTVFLIGGMIVYYFLAYHHFYTESLFDAPPVTPFRPYSSPPPRFKRKRKKYTH